MTQNIVQKATQDKEKGYSAVAWSQPKSAWFAVAVDKTEGR